MWREVPAQVGPSDPGEAKANPMIWHRVIMAEPEVAKFRHDLKRVYRKEIAAGRIAGYTLFARKEGPGDYVLYIPPGAVVLFDRMPDWRARLQPYSGTPDLRGFDVIPVGLSHRNSIHARSNSR